MRALYIHISGLVGLLVFLKEVLNYAPLERTILVSATTGLTVYLMLIVGHTIVQHIVAYSPPVPPSGDEEPASNARGTASEAVENATAAVAAANGEAPETDSNAAEAATSPEAGAPADSPPADAPPADNAAAAADAAPDRAPQEEQAASPPTNSVAQTTA
jgi:predicted lipid-binding transport protein (Tim44 family)